MIDLLLEMWLESLRIHSLLGEWSRQSKPVAESYGTVISNGAMSLRVHSVRTVLAINNAPARPSSPQYS